MKYRPLTPLLITAALALGCSLAHADDSGSQWIDGPFQLRVRGVWFEPSTSSDAFSIVTPGPVVTPIGSNALKLDSGFYPELSGEYYFTPNWSLEGAIAWPSNFDVKYQSQGIGHIKMSPNTLTVKYTFMPETNFRPYIGVGGSYTSFGDQHLYSNALSGVAGGSVDVDNKKYGWTGQLGLDYRFAEAGLRTSTCATSAT